MEKLIKKVGERLLFGTEIIGSENVYINYDNEWLHLEFWISKDISRISMRAIDVENHEFDYEVDNEIFKSLNIVDFSSMNVFNNTIESVLREVIGYDSSNFRDFELTGIAIDSV